MPDLAVHRHAAPALAIEALTYSYPRSPAAALSDVSLAIAPGEFALLAGRSASGKSTLLQAACGLVPHFHGGEIEGSVEVAGIDALASGPGELAAAVGYLAQDPETQVVSTTVAAEIELPLEMRGDPPASRARAVEEVALALAIPHLLEPHRRHAFGGGAAASRACRRPGHPPPPGPPRRAHLAARPGGRRRADLAPAPTQRGVGCGCPPGRTPPGALPRCRRPRRRHGLGDHLLRRLSGRLSDLGPGDRPGSGDSCRSPFLPLPGSSPSRGRPRCPGQPRSRGACRERRRTPSSLNLLGWGGCGRPWSGRPRSTSRSEGVLLRSNGACPEGPGAVGRAGARRRATRRAEGSRRRDTPWRAGCTDGAQRRRQEHAAEDRRRTDRPRAGQGRSAEWDRAADAEPGRLPGPGAGGGRAAGGGRVGGAAGGRAGARGRRRPARPLRRRAAAAGAGDRAGGADGGRGAAGTGGARRADAGDGPGAQGRAGRADRRARGARRRRSSSPPTTSSSPRPSPSGWSCWATGSRSPTGRPARSSPAAGTSRPRSPGSSTCPASSPPSRARRRCGGRGRDELAAGQLPDPRRRPARRLRLV